MEQLLHNIYVWVFSFILGLGVVWKLTEKYSPKIRKGLRIAEDISKTLNDLLDAMEDKKVTPEEIEKIIADIEHLKTELGGK